MYTDLMVMRRLYSMMMAAALCLTAAAEGEKNVDSDTGNDAKPPTKETAKEPDISKLKPVAKALARLNTFNATPNYKAKYYIYLQSASWCGPCCAEMPHIAKAYPAMKKKRVELILVGCDSTRDAAEKFLIKYGGTFPGVQIGEEGVSKLPGFTKSPSVPNAIFVDEKGKVLHSGHGSDVLKWESYIKKKPQKGKK